MYFWKNKYIPKELQKHISKTLKQALGAQKGTALPAQNVSDFLKEAQNILSGSKNKS